MTTTAILKRVNEVFRDVFDDSSLCVTETTTSEDVPDWDSLEHITLIASIEQEFGMKFKMKEIVSMKNVGEMIHILAQRASK